MTTRTLIAATVLAIAASLAGPSLAQEYTINGIAVPATELESVQMKCDELLANQATGLAKTLPAPAAAETPAPVNSAVATAQPAPATGGNMAADAPADTAAGTIDLASLTAEICTDGGFTPHMD